MGILQAAHAELGTSGGPFRAFDDALCGSMFLTLPLFSSLCLAGLREFVKYPLSSSEPMAGVKFGLAVWATTSLHGIFIDYQTFKISFNVPCLFWVSSGLSSATTGYLLAHFMSTTKGA